MEGPRAGISNVEQHVNQLEQRCEDCMTHKADAAAVPTTVQVNQHIRFFNEISKTPYLSVCHSVQAVSPA